MLQFYHGLTHCIVPFFLDLGIFLILSFWLKKCKNPILRLTNKRPEILADLITASTNPGTFNRILRKAVGFLFGFWYQFGLFYKHAFLQFYQRLTDVGCSVLLIFFHVHIQTTMNNHFLRKTNKRPGRISSWEGLSCTTSDVWQDSSKSVFFCFPFFRFLLFFNLNHAMLQFYHTFTDFGRSVLLTFVHVHIQQI